MHLDRRRLTHAQGELAVEIALHHTSVLDGKPLTQCLADAVKSGPLRLIFGVQRVDNLAADVARDPDLVDRDLATAADRSLDDLREVSEVTKVIRQSHPSTLRQRLLTPDR